MSSSTALANAQDWYAVTDDTKGVACDAIRVRERKPVRYSADECVVIGRELCATAAKCFPCVKTISTALLGKIIYSSTNKLVISDLDGTNKVTYTVTSASIDFSPIWIPTLNMILYANTINQLGLIAPLDNIQLPAFDCTTVLAGSTMYAAEYDVANDRVYLAFHKSETETEFGYIANVYQLPWTYTSLGNFTPMKDFTVDVPNAHLYTTQGVNISIPLKDFDYKLIRWQNIFISPIFVIPAVGDNPNESPRIDITSVSGLGTHGDNVYWGGQFNIDRVGIADLSDISGVNYDIIIEAPDTENMLGDWDAGAPVTRSTIGFGAMRIYNDVAYFITEEDSSDPNSAIHIYSCDDIQGIPPNVSMNFVTHATCTDLGIYAAGDVRADVWGLGIIAS